MRGPSGQSRINLVIIIAATYERNVKLRRFESGISRANGKLGNVLRLAIARLNAATFSIHDNAAELFIISIY